jgi:hypothetical protein
MQVVVSLDQINTQFASVMARAASGKERFVVKQDDEAVVIVSKQEFDELLRIREQQKRDTQNRLKRFQQAARAIGEELERRGISEEDLLNTLDDSKKVVYQRYYGNPQE